MRTIWFLSFLAACLVVPAATAQECDDDTRQQFIDAVAAGLPDEDLEAIFGRCRFDPDDDNDCDIGTAVSFGAGAHQKTISFPYRGNLRWETIRRCGYHPQNETVTCPVELKRRTGFGGFPTGTNQYVLYCLDCDRNGTWDFTALGSVHVTDDVSGSQPRWFFEASASTRSAPPQCTANDGQATDIRAILSWNRIPRNCTDRPFFGRWIDFTARRDP